MYTTDKSLMELVMAWLSLA